VRLSRGGDGGGGGARPPLCPPHKTLDAHATTRPPHDHSPPASLSLLPTHTPHTTPTQNTLTTSPSHTHTHTHTHTRHITQHTAHSTHLRVSGLRSLK
jgi:hypothetical protein